MLAAGVRWASFAALGTYFVLSLLFVTANVRWVVTGGLAAVKEPLLSDIYSPAFYLLVFRLGWRAVLLFFIALRPRTSTAFAHRCKLPRFYVIWIVLVWWLALLLLTEAIITIPWLVRNPAVFNNDEDFWRSDTFTRVALASLRFVHLTLDVGHVVFASSLIYYVLQYKLEIWQGASGIIMWDYLTTSDPNAPKANSRTLSGAGWVR